MLKSTPTCPLPDIREARIDPTLPVNERLRLFAAAIGDHEKVNTKNNPTNYPQLCGKQRCISACRVRTATAKKATASPASASC